MRSIVSTISPVHFYTSPPPSMHSFASAVHKCIVSFGSIHMSASAAHMSASAVHVCLLRQYIYGCFGSIYFVYFGSTYSYMSVLAVHTVYVWFGSTYFVCFGITFCLLRKCIHTFTVLVSHCLYPPSHSLSFRTFLPSIDLYPFSLSFIAEAFLALH